MKKGICFILFSALILIGCEKQEPLPLLGVEGVYLMGSVVDVEGVEQEEEEVGTNVYWFFEDRTFQKAQLKNERLVEATGIFAEIAPAEGGSLEGRQFELTYLTGQEIIEGCHVNREILIQVMPNQLVNEGHPCGEFNFYYDRFNFD